MISTTNTSYKLFYSMLFSPIIGYISIVLFNISDPVLIFRLIIVIYGILFLFEHKQKIKIPSFVYFFIVFVIYEYIWSFINGGPQGRFMNLSFIYGSKQFAIIFASLIIYNTHFSSSFIKTIIKLLKTTIILAFVTILIQFFYPSFLNATKYFDTDSEAIYNASLYTFRRTTFFGFINPNSLGLDFLPLLSIVIAFLILQKSKIRYLFVFLGAFVAFSSNIRYVMVGFVLLSFQIILSSRNKITGFVNYLITGLLLLIVIIYFASLVSFDFDKWISDRIFVETSVEESERFRAVYTFSTFFPENPIFGTGIFNEEIEEVANEDRSSNIHMGYLRSLVIYGLFGSFLLFGAWFLIARKFYQTAKSSRYWGSFFGFLVFIFSFATMYEFSIFFYGIIFLMIFDQYFNDRHSHTLDFHNKRLSSNDSSEQYIS